MRKLAMAVACLSTAGCVHKYQAPLSANVPIVDGSKQLYIDTLKVGYIRCLPTVDTPKKAANSKRDDIRGSEVNDDAPRCDPAIVSNFQAAGLTLSDIYCEEFFRRANATARRRGFARGLTNDVGGAIQAILGLAKVTTGVISGIGAGAAFADSTYRNYDESFMVDADLSRLRRLVNAAQDSMRLGFRTQDKVAPGNPALTIFTAESRIQRYAGLCSFLGMKNLLDSSLADKTSEIEKGNEDKQKSEPKTPPVDPGKKQPPPTPPATKPDADPASPPAPVK